MEMGRREQLKVKYSYFKQIRSAAIKRKVVTLPDPDPVLETVLKFVAWVFPVFAGVSRPSDVGRVCAALSSAVAPLMMLSSCVRFLSAIKLHLQSEIPFGCAHYKKEHASISRRNLSSLWVMRIHSWAWFVRFLSPKTLSMHSKRKYFAGLAPSIESRVRIWNPLLMNRATTMQNTLASLSLSWGWGWGWGWGWRANNPDIVDQFANNCNRSNESVSRLIAGNINSPQAQASCT